MTHSLDDVLVEKAARAIAGVCFASDWDSLSGDTRACFFPYARAALEAAGVAELREENARLREALALAVPIIERERDIIISCNTVLHKGSPGFGKVVDDDALEEIATYDEALAAAHAALTNQGKAQR